ncbi:MAG: ketoacyl-ACP synthase III [Clostridioides sp.]|jgi:3-oxoacyl-[acyl-carrier-protein] synthase-3|nr:ketoacyl-ACP synthase III [Clostridioides sp.]
MKYTAGIIGLGSCVPDRIMNNFDFEKIMDTSDEWIRTRTGIKERHIVSEGEANTDISIKAAKRAIEDAKIDPKDLDLIIVSTITPDTVLPPTSCLIQEMLGATNAAAFDISAACTGFIYALTIATQFIENGMYKNILVIGAEILSSITDYTDRTTSILFGDGAGAAILSRVDEGGILSTYIGADGSGKDYLFIPAGGSRLGTSVQTIEQNLHTVKMAGNEVFKFAVRKMEEASLEAIKKAGLKLEDVDFLIPHQANIRIINSSAKRLNMDMENVYINIDKYGNMSSASIPVALDEAYRKGKLKKGDNVLLVGFGGGLTWGSTMIKWNL